MILALLNEETASASTVKNFKGSVLILASNFFKKATSKKKNKNCAKNCNDNINNLSYLCLKKMANFFFGFIST